MNLFETILGFTVTAAILVGGTAAVMLLFFPDYLIALIMFAKGAL